MYHEKQGQFALVSIASPTSDDAAKFFKESGYDWTFGQGLTQLTPDGKGEPGPTDIYKVEGVPKTIFIDRMGNIVDTVDGGMEKAEFEAKLARIL